MVKKYLILILFILTTNNLFSQDRPSGYTENYGLRMWAQSSRPSADSLNQNWKDIDRYLHQIDSFKYRVDTSAFLDAEDFYKDEILIVDSNSSGKFFRGIPKDSVGEGDTSSLLSNGHTWTGVNTYTQDIYFNHKIHTYGGDEVVADTRIDLPLTGNFAIVSGSGTIETISTTIWREGDIIYLYNLDGFDVTYSASGDGEILNPKSINVNVIGGIFSFLLIGTQWILF